MKNIPIRQTTLATLAFTFSNWQKLLEVSIFPLLAALPFITILPELMTILQAQLFGVGEVQAYPRFYELYLLMFDYAYMALIINIYRLVVSGSQSVARLGVVIPSLRLGRFFLLFIFLSIATQFPIFISPFLVPVIYFLLIPISLNLVGLANDVPYKRIKLNLGVQFSVFLIKLGVPIILVGLTIIVGVNEMIFWGIMALIMYWMAISFALCYRVIMANSSTQSR
ncbi:MAG: hypothetical protein QGF84_00290 [Candidatus Thioglobus sp.]|mgnify:FL=1|nr:hypothetical protein [Candidatus Thioglobus sp.]